MPAQRSRAERSSRRRSAEPRAARAAATLSALTETDVIPNRPEYSTNSGRADVAGGMATISGEFADDAERRVVTALARTVPGILRAEVRAGQPGRSTSTTS
ncbi:hypothetical protein [Prauserella shujinwangii]|uniref:hypothetical protein n=1 Tax=Prauserella shujinwangii TaxID=1453103 RepID=UPI0011B20215|nr:hypothetical protein [Prauserella shujinwangii]